MKYWSMAESGSDKRRETCAYIRVHFLDGGIGVFPMTAHVCPAGQSVSLVQV
jgi:hypothetical protein